jgi:hypothetical protein
MTIYAKAPFKHVTEFNNSTIADLFATPEFTAAVNAIAGGGGLEGTNYLYVAADGTDIENAAELQAAYVTAQGMSPLATNRITIIAAPGNYNFESITFVMNTEYIDLVSLDGNRSIIFNSSDSNGTIYITADNVFVKGVDVVNKRFRIASSLINLVLENCKGLGEYSFGGDSFNYVDLPGTFINCEGGDFSFRAPTAAGTFINCKSGGGSFGYNQFFSVYSGLFEDVKAGSFNFSAECSGTFKNITGGAFNNAIIIGEVYNCVFSAGNPFTIVGGKVYYSRSVTQMFPLVSSGGKTYYCVNSDGSVNNQN